MEILERFRDIKTWRSGDERAPHKPLLILLMLGKLLNENRILISFEEIEEEFIKLFKNFGPSRKAYHPEYPFWRLQNDNIWQITNRESIRLSSSSDPSRRELITNNTEGGFTKEVLKKLSSNPSLIYKLAEEILDKNFPATLHGDIFEAVGLERKREYVSYVKEKRDSSFRERVLRTYGYRCAACGYDLKIGDQLVGIEGAHIKWHSAGGPASVSNGIALCSLHHSLFDAGVFTLKKDELVRILVSDQLSGSEVSLNSIKKLHKQRLLINPESHNKLSPDFMTWHNKEVFK